MREHIMKNLILANFLIAVFASNLLANPLIVKSNSPGYVHADYSRSEVCSLFIDRVEIKRSFGRTEGSSFTVTREIPISLDSDLINILTKANTENLQRDENYMCDGPSTSIYANFNEQQVTLFSSGGCGNPRLERIGSFSSMLIDLIDTYCPKTYDFNR